MWSIIVEKPGFLAVLGANFIGGNLSYYIEQRQILIS
jgi:hypothetical protein